MNGRWTRTLGTSSRSLDLGDVYQARAVHCRVEGARVNSFVVEASLDGQDWWPVLDHSTGTAAGAVSNAATGIARYFQLRGTGGAPIELIDFSVTFAPSGVDVTHLCRAEASSHRPVRESWRLLEDDVMASWHADGADPTARLILELPEPRHVVALEHTWAATEAQPPRISVSVDGTTWRPVPGGLRPGVVDSLEVGTDAQFVRADYLQGSPQVGSLRVFARPRPNDADQGLDLDLAAGCATSASSSSPGCLPQEAVRTGTEATWRPAPDDPAPVWQVDLGHPCTLRSVEARLGRPGDEPVVEVCEHRNRWRTWDGRPVRARWVRLSLPTADQTLEQVVISGRGSPQRARWWQEGAPTYRYFPKEYGIHLRDVADALPTLRARGFRCIELAGIKQGPPSAFAGLGATDPYAVDERIGSVTDLVDLIDQAHRHGIRVVVFDNLGYAHTEAPDFRAAVERFRTDPDHADPYPYLLSVREEGERWYRDEPTGIFYYAYWGQDLPSFNWSDQRWRDESRDLLRYWLGLGVDGLGIDAPQVYPGIDDEAAREYIGTVLSSAGVWAFVEGVHTRRQGARQDVYERMVADLAFNVILDLTISVWHQPRDNALVPAIAEADLTGLEALLRAGRDVVSSAGGVTIEAPAWEADLGEKGTPDVERTVSPRRRLLEIAILAGAGSFFYLTDGVHTYRPEIQTIPTWPPDQRNALDQLLRAVSGHAALGPSGLRMPIPTGADAHLAWLRTDRTGTVRAIAVFNAAPHPADIGLDLKGLAVDDQQPLRLLGGESVSPIRAGRCTVRLDGYGYAYLRVE